MEICTGLETGGTELPEYWVCKCSLQIAEGPKKKVSKEETGRLHRREDFGASCPIRTSPGREVDEGRTIREGVQNPCIGQLPQEQGEAAGLRGWGATPGQHSLAPGQWGGRVR